MSPVTREQAESFAAAAGALAIAGVLTRACPGGCTSCATCATSLLPLGASAAAVGTAFLGSAGIRARKARRDCATLPENDSDRG